MNQGIGLIFKTFIRTSVFFAVQFTLSRSSPSVRNAKHLRTFCFLEVIFAFGEIFVNQRVLLQLDLHWRQPLNSHEECIEFADLFFKDHHYELFCLSRDSYVLCHSLIRSSYFIQVYIFIPLIYPAPFLCFSHILLTPIFFICIIPWGIFFFSIMMPLIRESSEFNFNF